LAKKKPRRSSHDGDDPLFNGNADAERSEASGFNGDASQSSDRLIPIALHEAAQVRYLNYSLSVITSRALPDVRDGLKPVQRRILYTMWQQGLRPDAKPRKCATVAGEVMGKYHPHGDQAIYEALVRMAQPWVLRHTLIEGQGNFGSIDDDPPAAMRYTECRLAPVAVPLLDDLGNQTVPFRPNYDGTREEPVVLPARLPAILVNGSAGIAVGMATNIPPHNLGEVINACLKLLKDPELKPYQLIAKDAIQGPDFPTGGQVITPAAELREIYKNGQGTIKLRATTRPGPETRSAKTMIIDAVPYGVNKAALVMQIAELVIQRKLPLLLDVRDLSADDIRIELDLKKDADEAKVLAYLFKHTQMQVNIPANLTVLVPTENPEVNAPHPQCDIKTILWHFIHFRHDVITARLSNELAALQKRLHILDGFALVFDALDEIIKIIRKSEGKQDAAKKIMERFKQLDEEQTDAILELKLYRLARLEINLITEERRHKQARVKEIQKLLGDDDSDMGSGRWKIVANELIVLRDEHAKTEVGKRRTTFAEAADEPEFTEEDFIVAEDCAVLLTADGWVKRQKEIKDPQATRLREGDRVLACLVGSTRATVGFFSSLGTCYTCRFIDVPASTGYGEPVQKLFKLKDGETILSAISFDERVTQGIEDDPKHPDRCPMLHGFAATSDGFALRFGLSAFKEPSTRAGRKFARPAKGHQVVGFAPVHGSETVLAVSAECRGMVCRADEVNYLAGPGKGVMLIKLGNDDRLLGFKASTGDRDLLTYETGRGATDTLSTAKYRTVSRGGKGIELKKNGRFKRIVPEPVAATSLA
jgi:DNA gyrase subunit A